MSELEKKLGAWRSRFEATGSFTRTDLDELEGHLRDHVDALAEAGKTGDEAFAIAESRLGDPKLLSREYDKINPGRAWQPPLMFMALGCLALLLGTNVLGVLSEIAIIVGVRLGLSAPVMRVVAWVIVLGAPFVFFGGLYALSRRRAGYASLVATPRARVLLLTGTSLFAIAMQLSYYPLASFGRPLADEPAWAAAWGAEMRAMYFIALAIPSVLGLLAVRHHVRVRRGVAKSSALHGGLKWLLFGSFVAVVCEELSPWIWQASLLAGAHSGLSVSGLEVLTWIVTLVTPSLLLGIAHVWIHRRAPTPDRVISSRVFLVAIALACGAAIAALKSMTPLAETVHATLRHDTRMAMFMSWELARIVAIGIAPVTIGSIVLRARAAYLPIAPR